MAPSPSYQPVATGPVATSCDLPAQRTTTRASSLRGRFRGDGALAIVSASRPPFGRNGLRPSRAMCDDEGVVATGALSWRWCPRHRISMPPSVRSQWIATIPRNVRRRGRRRYEIQQMAKCNRKSKNRKSKILSCAMGEKMWYNSLICLGNCANWANRRELMVFEKRSVGTRHRLPVGGVTPSTEP